MVVALIALFIALGGPATAKRWIDGGSIKRNSITTTQIRNRTIRSADISKAAVEALQHTPSASVGPAQLRPKAVDSTKLADAAVGAAQLAPGAVGGAAIANGSLQAPDLGDFFGSVTVDFAPFDNETNRCQTAMVAAPTPTSNPKAKIADDLIMVTPAQAGFSDLLTLAGYPGVNNSLRIVACRVGAIDPAIVVDPPSMRFLYLGIDAP